MEIARFTYDAYRDMLQLLIEQNYLILPYLEADKKDKNEKVCILRHDIDCDINKAVQMAEIENQMGLKSTYFVLLRTDMYNPASAKSIKLLRKIIDFGADIGLHFDEMSYINNSESVPKLIKKEAKILSEILDYEIQVVSMHRPSKGTLEANYEIEGLVNSYSTKYLKQYKYISDSRYHWRENAEQVISSKLYDKLHILTHPMSYTLTGENTREKLLGFICRANKERYSSLNDNFRDLAEFVKEDEV